MYLLEKNIILKIILKIHDRVWYLSYMCLNNIIFINKVVDHYPNNFSWLSIIYFLFDCLRKINIMILSEYLYFLKFFSANEIRRLFNLDI